MATVRGRRGPPCASVRREAIRIRSDFGLSSRCCSRRPSTPKVLPILQVVQPLASSAWTSDSCKSCQAGRSWQPALVRPRTVVSRLRELAHAGDDGLPRLRSLGARHGHGASAPRRPAAPRRARLRVPQRPAAPGLGACAGGGGRRGAGRRGRLGRGRRAGAVGTDGRGRGRGRGRVDGLELGRRGRVGRRVVGRRRGAGRCRQRVTREGIFPRPRHTRPVAASRPRVHAHASPLYCPQATRPRAGSRPSPRAPRRRRPRRGGRSRQSRSAS